MMTKDLEGIYKTACSAKGFKPDGEQFKTWKKTLIGCDRSDLELALMTWFSTHAGFPMPADLRPVAEDAKRKRTALGAEAYQQQQCPKCDGIVGMMRPLRDQFRTWCVGCQSYRKIIPEDQRLTAAEWNLLCAELEAIYYEWVRRGSKYKECLDPRFDRELVRGRAA